jgi:hypothetical protein
MKEKWYEIDNMKEFVSSLRTLVLDSFYENDSKDELLSFTDLLKEKKKDIEKKLTIQEAHNIIEPMLKKTTTSIGKQEYIISHKNFKKMLNNLQKRIISNMLLELTLEGKLESGFDESKKDFIFWLAE